MKTTTMMMMMTDDDIYGHHTHPGRTNPNHYYNKHLAGPHAYLKSSCLFFVFK